MEKQKKKSPAVGIRISHHRLSNKWYQMVCTCKFYHDDTDWLVELSRVEIDEETAQKLIECLEMVRYINDEVSYYGNLAVLNSYNTCMMVVKKRLYNNVNA